MNILARAALGLLLALALVACAPVGSEALPQQAELPAPAMPQSLEAHGHDAPALTADMAPKQAPTLSLAAQIAALPTAEPTAPPPTAEPTAPPPTAEPTAPPPTLVPPTAEPTAIPIQAEPTAAPVEIAAATAAPIAVAAAPLSEAPRAPVRIIIESIGLDRSLVAVGLDDTNMPVVPDYDVAWYNRSAAPTQGENVVIWGHALRFQSTPGIAAPLERVKEAQVGDSIVIIGADGAAHRYVIREQVWVTPNQVQFILPVGYERLTIVNCIGDLVVDENGNVVTMTHRLITIAEPAP